MTPFLGLNKDGFVIALTVLTAGTCPGEWASLTSAVILRRKLPTPRSADHRAPDYHIFRATEISYFVFHVNCCCLFLLARQCGSLQSPCSAKLTHDLFPRYEALVIAGILEFWCANDIKGRRVVDRVNWYTLHCPTRIHYTMYTIADK